MKRLGKSHPLTIQSYLQLAYVFEHVNMRHKALQCYEELLAQQTMFTNASTMSSAFAGMAGGINGMNKNAVYLGQQFGNLSSIEKGKLNDILVTR